MERPVDLRSDTVTVPSPAMRRAMAEAEVGDDWYGEDPTVNRLQDAAAEVTGKEAALYVPTGTMANQIGMRLSVEGSGHLVACEANAHVATTEVMTSAVLSGISFRRIPSAAGGQLTAADVSLWLEPDAYFDVEMVDLLALENTHGASGGTVMPLEEMRAIRRVAGGRGIPVHLDGARLFNAAVAAGVEVADYAAEADTLMFCVSKGLGAPIGSVVCGEREAIGEARRLKILFGGAWRQAGIMAAAGLVALEEGPKRLHEDHERARRLAEGIAETTPGSVDLGAVQTNMVFVDAGPLGRRALEVVEELERDGVRTTPAGERVRMVTHTNVDDADIDAALAAWGRVVAG